MQQRGVFGRCAALSLGVLVAGFLAACQPLGDTRQGPSSDSLIGRQGPYSDQLLQPTGQRGAVLVTGRTAVSRSGPLESQPTGDELTFVTALLTDMQRSSFARNREACGYIGRDAQGRMMASRINIGDEASCYLPALPQGMRPLASVHTHGRYSPYYASEFPTVQDMTTDAEDGIDGYISTPGGRLWYVDTDTMTVRQLCGRGCLPQDPRYRPEDDGPVRNIFTLRDLQRWENQ